MPQVLALQEEHIPLWLLPPADSGDAAPADDFMVVGWGGTAHMPSYDPMRPVTLHPTILRDNATPPCYTRDMNRFFDRIEADHFLRLYYPGTENIVAAPKTAHLARPESVFGEFVWESYARENFFRNAANHGWFPVLKPGRGPGLKIPNPMSLRGAVEALGDFEGLNWFYGTGHLNLHETDEQTNYYWSTEPPLTQRMYDPLTGEIVPAGVYGGCYWCSEHMTWIPHERWAVNEQASYSFPTWRPLHEHDGKNPPVRRFDLRVLAAGLDAAEFVATGIVITPFLAGAGFAARAGGRVATSAFRWLSRKSSWVRKAAALVRNAYYSTRAFGQITALAGLRAARFTASHGKQIARWAKQTGLSVYPLLGKGAKSIWDCSSMPVSAVARPLQRLSLETLKRGRALIAPLVHQGLQSTTTFTLHSFPSGLIQGFTPLLTLMRTTLGPWADKIVIAVAKRVPDRLWSRYMARGAYMRCVDPVVSVFTAGRIRVGAARITGLRALKPRRTSIDNFRWFIQQLETRIVDATHAVAKRVGFDMPTPAVRSALIKGLEKKSTFQEITAAVMGAGRGIGAKQADDIARLLFSRPAPGVYPIAAATELVGEGAASRVGSYILWVPIRPGPATLISWNVAYYGIRDRILTDLLAKTTLHAAGEAAAAELAISAGEQAAARFWLTLTGIIARDNLMPWRLITVGTITIADAVLNSAIPTPYDALAYLFECAYTVLQPEGDVPAEKREAALERLHEFANVMGPDALKTLHPADVVAGAHIAENPHITMDVDNLDVDLHSLASRLTALDPSSSEVKDAELLLDRLIYEFAIGRQLGETALDDYGPTPSTPYPTYESLPQVDANE